VTPDRVVSLVAAGGTGKTALVERVLADLGERQAAGVVVWSFYEDPRTEQFLRAACDYFTGEAPASAGGLLERLQAALAGDEPHLLVLDGLELVQAVGTTGRPRGELEDPQLRRLLRWLAAGQGTEARVLVTSRFPLVDLEAWVGVGHWEERLEDLDPAAARAVLRGWGVRGDDAALDALARPLHGHALSVAVLGSYLANFWGGDPTKAPAVDRGELAAGDPRAAKLSRLLAHYAERLPDAERDLLARLSTFPHGVTVESLGFVISAGGDVAGALAGHSQARLLWLLERLRDLGLVFRSDAAQGTTFTAHPFLRDYFRGLLGSRKPEAIHEAVRVRLAQTVKPGVDPPPTDPAMLDRYEDLIEHTRLAGRPPEAFALYRLGLGGSPHLGHVLGDYARGLRILSGFSEDGSPEAAAPDLPPVERRQLTTDWGLFAENLGDLATAGRAFAAAAELSRQEADAKGLAITLRNQAEVALLAGRNPSAREVASAALVAAERGGDRTGTKLAHACLARAFARMGQLDEARRHLAAAAEWEEKWRLGSLPGTWEAEFAMAIGDRGAAAAQARGNRAIATQNNWTHVRATCDALLGLLALPDDPGTARQHLDAARNYASHSGSVDVQLRCYHLAAEIARAERAYDLARSEAEAGIHLADTCGFGHYAIELRLSLARAHLDAGDPKTALQRAREALDRSVHPECQYAWGEADALHLCGVAHARLGEAELARQRLTAALAKREALTHPGLPDTRAELDRLGGPAGPPSSRNVP
jgi:tetratricopeptide (TPR) repeat protein